jgi:hypothetical protein
LDILQRVQSIFGSTPKIVTNEQDKARLALFFAASVGCLQASFQKKGGCRARKYLLVGGFL